MELPFKPRLTPTNVCRKQQHGTFISNETEIFNVSSSTINNPHYFELIQ